jgi:hypothetical protein
LVNRLKCGHFCHSAQVPLGVAELCGEERLDKVPGNRRALGPPAETEHVQMIVCHALPDREMVLDQGGAHASDLVGANAGTDAAAANRDAAIHPPRRHGARERDHEIGIVVVRVKVKGTKVDDLMPSGPKPSGYFLLQGEPTVIGGNPNVHHATFSPGTIVEFCRI